MAGGPYSQVDKMTASQGYEMYCHDLEVMGLNPGQGRTWGA